MTGFYMKCNTELKCVNIAENLLKVKKSVTGLSQIDTNFSSFTTVATHSILDVCGSTRYVSEYLPDFTSIVL